MEINTNTHIGPSFSLRNRIMRLNWNIVYLLFFKYSPRPAHLWRKKILQLFGAKIGNGVHVYPKVVIWAPWNLILLDGAGIGNDVKLYSQGLIQIGKNAVVSQGTHLCAGTHDYTKKGFPLITKPIIIEDDVWIASEVFVHPGITIGEGSVIGARSVVTTDIPSWKIASGFPCKVLKERILTD